MALFKTEPSELDWLQVWWYDTLMKNWFKDWSQSTTCATEQMTAIIFHILKALQHATQTPISIDIKILGL